jgi:hypothetical protein
MIYSKFSSSIAIDENLKKYILKLNNNYIERWKQTKNKQNIDLYNQNSNYIKDLQMDIINSNSNHNSNFIITKKPYILYFWMIFSFLSGYQFRSLLDRYIFS